MADKNLLFYGDNLEVLRLHVKDESVDMVYLDPPFNSNQDYNVLFGRREGHPAAAQIRAFEDTWGWDQAAARAYEETVEAGGDVSKALQSFWTLLGPSDMLAYLAMMAPRLVELRRVLKPTGCIYLHCDPTASHYLKLLMDAVFGAANFRAEIVWKRSGAHSDAKQGRKAHGRIHDILLFYTRGPEWTWNTIYTRYDEEYVERHYPYVDEETGRRFQPDNLTAARPGGDTSYQWRIKRHGGGSWVTDRNEEYRTPIKGWEYRGVAPPAGRYWAYSAENMRAFDREGRIYYTRNGSPRYKRFLDEMPGVPLQDIWTDIPPINSQAAERLGYPTQKPQALLDRIIASSSSAGSVVLDPFCGCGTAVASAQKLGRRWLGIDITHLAINLIRHRLTDTYGPQIDATYEVIGEPVTVDGAEILAAEDPYQFQFWALGLVGARPHEEKKGADKGIDGRLYFHDEGVGGKTKQVIISVKAGNTGPAHVRDLRGVIDREKAQIGVLVTMQEPTQKMREEAASAGFYDSPWGKHPRIQIITVGELLEGKRIDYPATTGSNVTFKKAPKAESKGAEQLHLTEPLDPVAPKARPRKKR